MIVLRALRVLSVGLLVSFSASAEEADQFENGRDPASYRPQAPKSLEIESNTAPSPGEVEPGLSGDWGGARKNLSNRGVDLAVIYKCDYITNTHGGVERRSAFFGNLDLRSNFDGEKLFNAKGLTFFVYGLANHGADKDGPASNFVGDRQTTSNIETGTDSFRLYEAYAQQTWLDGNVSLLAGLHDLNSEFYVTSSSSLFLNASLGVGRDLSQTGFNGPSIFPVTAPSLRLKVQPAKTFYFQAAVFNGLSGSLNDQHGTTFSMNAHDGQLIIMEAAVLKGDADQKDYGKFALGTWTYTKTFNHLTSTVTAADGSTVAEQVPNHGTYFLAESFMTKNTALFFRYGIANGDANTFAANVSAGVNIQGLLPPRPNDRFGFAWTRVNTSAAYQSAQERAGTPAKSFEETFELAYRLSLGRGVFLQPDFQFVHYPGADPEIPDAHVVIGRIEINF